MEINAPFTASEAPRLAHGIVSNTLRIIHAATNGAMVFNDSAPVILGFVEDGFIVALCYKDNGSCLIAIPNTTVRGGTAYPVWLTASNLEDELWIPTLGLLWTATQEEFRQISKGDSPRRHIPLYTGRPPSLFEEEPDPEKN